MKLPIIAFLSALPILAHASEIKLAWSPSPTTGITNYVLNASSLNGTNIVNSAFINVGTNLTAIVDVSPGRWQFAAFAEKDGVRSDPSNTLTVEVPQSPSTLRTIIVEATANLTSTNWTQIGLMRVRLE